MRLIWVAKWPTFWSKRESEPLALSSAYILTKFTPEESVLESELLLRSSSLNVCPALFFTSPADERVSDTIRTDLASCPLNRVRSWYSLRRL